MVLRSELTELGPLASAEEVRGTLTKPPGCSDERLRLPRDLSSTVGRLRLFPAWGSA